MTELSSGKTDTIVRVVELKADPKRVWRAVADYREFGTWFRVELDQPFTPGGRSTGRMTYPGAEGLGWLAYVETMDAPRRLVLRWHLDPVDADTSEAVIAKLPTTEVEFLLEPTDAGGTRLTITESGFAALPADRHAEQIRGNGEGWDIQSEHIRVHVDG